MKLVPRHTLTKWAGRVVDITRRVASRARPLARVTRRLVMLPIAAWHGRAAITIPAAWPGLRWIDRPLAILLRLEPRLLTSRVLVARVPFPGTFAERVRYWLWESHSVRAGICMSLLIGIGMCLLALGASSTFRIPMLGVRSDIDGMPTMIIAGAAYLGGLFGFLQAVTIFAVQLRSQQDTSMLPLTPLIARRYFTFFVLGAIAGVTIANLVAALATPVLPVNRSVLAALSWLNLFAVPGATVTALWYLATIVSEAGEADMDIALPILRATMRAQTHADAHQVEILNEYGRRLDAAEIRYDPIADSSLRSSTNMVRVAFGRPGVLIDVDCHRLSSVGQLLKEIPSSPEAAVTVALGQPIQSDNALILRWASLATPTPSASLPLKEELQTKLGSALAGVFVVQRGPRTHVIAKDVRRFLKRFQTTLAVLAREGRHVELEARFEDFHKLLDAWLDIAPPGTAPPERLRFLTLVDRFGGPFEIDTYEVVRAATLSGDTSTVVVVADQLMRGAFACYRHDQPRLMEELLNTLVFLYYQCAERDGLADAIGYNLDSGLHSLFMSMRSNKVESTDERASESRDVSMLEVVLRFSLALTHAAIRYEQSRHATYFVERIFEHRKYRSHHNRADAPVAMSTEVLFDYVAVVLAGWSLHILQSNVLKTPDAARTVLATAISQAPSTPILVAEWELLRGAEWHDASIDNRLGIARWDVRDWQREFRSGVGDVRSGCPDWVRLGLRAALLRNEKRFFGNSGRLFSGQPRRFVWDAAKEREALLSLSADQWIELPEGERKPRVESVMQIIESRARGANAEYLRYVLESPLAESRVSQLRDDAVKAFASKQTWQRALRHAGLTEEQMRSCPLRTRWGTWVPREYLLEDNNWASGFGKHLGEEAAKREAMALVHLIETNALRAGYLSALAELPEKVREVRRLMSDAGFKPNVIILPREDRFAGALFQKPLWQVEGRHEFGEASIGSWEQLHVLRFPYTNPESILLLDTRRLLAQSGSGDGTAITRIWIEEHPANEEVEAKRHAASAALNTADLPIPESSTLQVLAWMEVTPGLGLVDMAAARAIDVRGGDGGFAITEGSNLYHRPLCPDIEGEDPAYVLRVEPDAGKLPCPTCRPDQWNVEGRLGKGWPTP
jgi:hypothetical protein